jgi:hypothetical protein
MLCRKKNRLGGEYPAGPYRYQRAVKVELIFINAG